MNGWFKLKECFNHPDEWHAFWIGLFEVIAFWKPRCPAPTLEYILKEWHYYMWGRAAGVICWIGLIAWIKRIIV